MKITVFDQNNKLIGETFPRRAKQLVRVNRARWLNDSLNSICLAQNIASDKEGKFMANLSSNELSIDENVIQQQENKQDATLKEAQFSETTEDKYLQPKPEDELLLYLAKRNVKLRHSLFHHMAAWVVSFFLLFIITGGFGGRPIPSAFYGGFYFAWALLILHKIYVILRSWLYGRKTSVKIDPVKAEYERLKAAASETVAAELKRL